MRNTPNAMYMNVIMDFISFARSFVLDIRGFFVVVFVVDGLRVAAVAVISVGFVSLPAEDASTGKCT